MEPDVEEAYRPQLYDASHPDTVAILRGMRASGDIVLVTDRLEDQVRELLETREPAETLTPNQMDARLRSYLGDTAISRHGMWAYYPWSKRLVHVLGEDDFRW